MLDSAKIYNDLQQELFELDKERIRFYSKVRPFKYLFWIPFLAGGVYFLWIINIVYRDPEAYLVFVFGGWNFVALIAYLTVGHYNREKFKVLFNGAIAPKIINGLGESFSYDYKGQIPVQEIKGSQLFKSFGTYSCQDLVMGVIDDVAIKFAEIKMTKTVRSSGSNGSSREQNIFRGFFFAAALELKFPTKIWLVTASNADISKTGLKKIRIDHPALKPYTVFAEDDTLAKKVLQPFILEKIRELNSKLRKEKIAIFKTSVSFYFEDQTIKMAIKTSKKFMEPRLSQTVNSQKFIEKQTRLLNTLSGLLKDLTLK